MTANQPIPSWAKIEYGNCKNCDEPIDRFIGGVWEHVNLATDCDFADPELESVTYERNRIVIIEARALRMPHVEVHEKLGESPRSEAEWGLRPRKPAWGRNIETIDPGEHL